MTDHPGEFFATPDLTVPKTRIVPVHSERLDTGPPRMRLGEALVEAGVITGAQLDSCLAEQAGEEPGRGRRRVGEIIVGRGLATEADIAQGLAAMMGFEFVDLFLETPEPSAVRRLPRAVAERFGVVPLRAGATWLRIAVADPTDTRALAAVREAARVASVSVALSTPSGIKGAIVRVWDGPAPLDEEVIDEPAAVPAPPEPEPERAWRPATRRAAPAPDGADSVVDPYVGSRWEYTWLGDGMPMEHPGYCHTADVMDERLALLGEDGWEAVGLHSNLSRVRILLRRSLPAADS